MKYIIDRIEKNIVICENQETKQMEQFNKEQFQNNIKEGDIVYFEKNTFKVDSKETDKKKKEIEELMKKLMKG